MPSVLGHLLTFFPQRVQECFAQEGGLVLREKTTSAFRKWRLLAGQEKRHLENWFFSKKFTDRPMTASSLVKTTAPLLVSSKVRYLVKPACRLGFRCCVSKHTTLLGRKLKNVGTLSVRFVTAFHARLPLRTKSEGNALRRVWGFAAEQACGRD